LGSWGYWEMGRILTTLATLAALAAGGPHAAPPADPEAHPDAHKLLDYIATLHLRPEKRVISGQFLGYGYNVRNGYQNEVASIQGRTGKWIALVATDFACSGDGYTDYCNALSEYWKAGHLISLSYHAPNPGGTFSDLPSNPAWTRSLDFMATRLKYLQDRGVMVLWRPFHEMNGDWFWWGAKSPAEFKAAWQHMFRYFTEVKGLHNLLWVFAPDDSRGRAADYYPGDAFTDIVGLDNYNFGAAELDLDSYESMVALGKPFGLTEFSPKSNQNTPEQADWKVLVEGGMKDKYPRIAFFLAWDVEWGLNYNRNGDMVMKDAWIIDRASLTWRQGGVTTLIAEDGRMRTGENPRLRSSRLGLLGFHGRDLYRLDGRLPAPASPLLQP
jgi:mannan endo-1,4-beta-mannosidase